MKFPRYTRILTRQVKGVLVACLLLFGATAVFAADPFTIICDGEATDISSDGSVVVGVTADTYETWRWTKASGRSLLGRFGGEAKINHRSSPDVSDDGRIISSTVLTQNALSETVALWSEKTGWETPAANSRAPGLGIQEMESLAWGLSGDGSTLVGQIRAANDSTYAVAWGSGGPLVLLDRRGSNQRANDTNSDGSVIVGWSEDPTTGVWQPTVWNERGAVVLAPTKVFCEASAVSPTGVIIVGQAYDESRDIKVAALWLNSDFGWVQESLGTLPGTIAGYGQAMALDLTADAHTIVGFNLFNSNRSTGFIWTLEGGMVDVHEHLTRHGVVLPEGFRILSVTGISDDGAFMTGYGEDTTFWPSQKRSFIIDVKDFPRERPRKIILPAGSDVSNPFKTKVLK